MTGLGDYWPDPTEGIDDPKNLPPTKIKSITRVRKKCPCPNCKRPARGMGCVPTPFMTSAISLPVVPSISI